MKKNVGFTYTLPLTIWLTIFFAVPIMIIFVGSFLKKSTYGGFEAQFSLDAYISLLNPGVRKVILKTLFIAIVSTIITILMAIPTAYYIARSKYKNMFLLLIIIPFWTNFLIRVFAWMTILGNNGLINNMLLSIGFISKPLQLLNNQWAVILLMIYTYLPFAILPLYTTIEKFDFGLLEAARDLGATKFQAFYKILIPGIIPGITTAVLFTFIPVFGNFAIPDIVGGKDSVMIGNLINSQLKVVKNYPFASSLSVTLTLVTTIAVFMFMQITKLKRDRIHDKNKVVEDSKRFMKMSKV